MKKKEKNRRESGKKIGFTDRNNIFLLQYIKYLRKIVFVKLFEIRNFYKLYKNINERTFHKYKIKLLLSLFINIYKYIYRYI